MGEILNLERSDCSRIGNIILRPLVCCEPAEKSAFKFITLDGPHHGVARMRNKPKKNVIWRSSRYELGMAWSNIPIVLAMDQQHRNSRMRNGCQRIGLQQMDSITHTRIRDC
jgi:hypothetical protein